MIWHTQVVKRFDNYVEVHYAFLKDGTVVQIEPFAHTSDVIFENSPENKTTLVGFAIKNRTVFMSGEKNDDDYYSPQYLGYARGAKHD
jgi:hypothetical protein